MNDDFIYQNKKKIYLRISKIYFSFSANFILIYELFLLWISLSFHVLKFFHFFYFLNPLIFYLQKMFLTELN